MELSIDLGTAERIALGRAELHRAYCLVSLGATRENVYPASVRGAG
jgi:hypothetical protein